MWVATVSRLEDFDCVATNELIARRLDIQRYNHKCKYESGYIYGDITDDVTKDILYSQIDLASQKVLLIAKTYSIRQNITSESEEHIFEFGKFLYVLSIGWEDETVLEITENDYCDVIHTINCHYIM